MGGIEDLLRKRSKLLQEIDSEILKSHTCEVTLLFTDIVGSTHFFEKWGDIAGRQMIQAHNDLLFPIITEYKGRIIKTIGDSIMAVFDEPSMALNCTVSLQRAIAAHDEVAPEILRFSVRMGLHYGRAVLDEKDLFGNVVNTAVRVESLADGGEILLSAAVRDQIGDCGVPLTNLGSETVKGREHTVELYTADWQDLGSDRILASWQNRHDTQKHTEDDASSVNISTPSRRVILGPVPDVLEETAHITPLPDRGNPYLNRVMIPHPDMFIGRHTLVRRILGRLSGSRPQSISLVGERRIGKSSLLNYLRSPRARAEALESPESCLFVFIDFQQVRALGPERLISILITELRRQTKMQIEGEEDYDCMRLVAEVVAERGFRLVFLFDEFEVITRTQKIGPELYSFLRSLANAYSVSFICVSGRNLKDLCATRAISDSPFFNIFSIIHVGALNHTDAKSLVFEPSAARGIPLAPLVELILTMGGYYPFFLQIACSAWFEFLEWEGGTAEEFAAMNIPTAVLEVFREEAIPHFEFILESLPSAEYSVLRSAADTALSPNSDDSVERILQRKGYLVKRDEGFVPFSEEFTRFVRNFSI